MTLVDPFWAGALIHGAGSDLERLRAAGHAPPDVPYGALAEACGDLDRARRWLAAPPLRTRGRLLTCLDPGWPQRLRALDDAPAALLVEGDPACLASRPSVAIVGTRRCTAYGRSVARTLGRALAAAGAVVVSGLARGVDAWAHHGAVEAGRTVAVLGHGLGHMSPASNRALRDAIVANGGAVVSIWPDDFEATRWTFPRRNRWIAALSDHVVVVEAPARSGALITASEALSMHVEGPSPVWAVPGPIGVDASAGCLLLLSEGARVVRSVESFVDAVVGRRPPAAPVDDAWLARLCAGASLDEVARLRGVSTLELVRELTRLELRGEVVRLPGQRYARGGGPSHA